MDVAAVIEGFHCADGAAMSGDVELCCPEVNGTGQAGIHRGIGMSRPSPEIASALEDRRVRYLYEAVVAGSIRAAADKLDMNPSVVSRQVAQLEAELSMPLLERLGRGVKATEAGQMLVDYFRQHTSHKEDVLNKLDEVRGLARGHIDLVRSEE